VDHVPEKLKTLPDYTWHIQFIDGLLPNGKMAFVNYAYLDGEAELSFELWATDGTIDGTATLKIFPNDQVIGSGK